ncbi:hypothetical protein PYCC9005_000095 [Savitreella phatthalungensis]
MALVDYDGESSDDDVAAVPQTSADRPLKRQALDVAPTVIGAPIEEADALGDAVRVVKVGGSRELELTANVRLSALSRPVYGPANPLAGGEGDGGRMRPNVLTGYAEEHAIDDVTFARAYRAGDRIRHPGTVTRGTVTDVTGGSGKSASRRAAQRELKRRRQAAGSAETMDEYRGPWAGYVAGTAEVYDDEDASDDGWEGEVRGTQPIITHADRTARPHRGTTEETVFYGAAERDYQGRTYMAVPRDVDGVDFGNFDDHEEDEDAVAVPESFLPKRIIHTFDTTKGHTRAVTALEFLPRSGHLLLSGGADSRLLLWDAHHDRRLLREFKGHGKAVRDISFSGGGGERFVSASFDTSMKVWDTETGQCITRLTTGKTPLCVQFHTASSASLAHRHEILAGTADRKIVQLDTRLPSADAVVQSYDHHLGPVNTVTLVDDGRRFVTTSDDKTVRAWEYGIGVPIKLIADPTMAAIPAVAPRPPTIHAPKYLAAQTLDDRILVFSCGEGRVKLHKRKVFSSGGGGGYATGLAFSGDGKYLAGGDGNGHVCVWDWKSSGLVAKYNAHNGPLTKLAYHPRETSKLATAGVDGQILYWD